jgi:hypothetical protein
MDGSPGARPVLCVQPAETTEPSGDESTGQAGVDCDLATDGRHFRRYQWTVCSEGDKVEGFRVERIEDDRVILENDEWREVVRFPGAAASELPDQEYPEQPESTAADSGEPVATASRENRKGS